MPKPNRNRDADRAVLPWSACVLLTALAVAGILGWLKLTGGSSKIAIREAAQVRQRTPETMRHLRFTKPGMKADEFENALSLALGLTDVVERKRELERLLTFVRHRNFPAALALTDGFAGTEVQAFRDTILSRWTHVDPLAALEGCRALSDVVVNAEARLLVWSQWTERNSAEALDWFIKNGSPDDRVALHPLARAMMNADRREAIRTIEASPSEFVRQELFEWFLGQWATEDVVGAAKAALEWTDSPRLSAAGGSFLSQWARHEPLEAARYVATLPPGERQNQAALVAVNAYANDSPGRAAEWVVRFPEGPVRDEAMALALTKWMKAEGEGVAVVVKWIGELEPGTTRDAVIGIYTSLSPEKYRQAGTVDRE
jgi:hypothetical protein